MIPRRKLLLGLALAATLAATWWAASLEEGTPEPTAGDRASAVSPSRSGGAPAAAVSLASLDAPRPALPALPGFLQPRSLQPPPPPPPPASKPKAPPLPFRFVGAIEEGDGRAVFLLEGIQVRVVRAGDELGGQYRVERITPASVEFIYLPLKERQILATARP
jgi:hypothetical protein